MTHIHTKIEDVNITGNIANATVDIENNIVKYSTKTTYDVGVQVTADNDITTGKLLEYTVKGQKFKRKLTAIKRANGKPVTFNIY